MASRLSDNATVFFDATRHIVSLPVLVFLSSLSAESLESLVNAAASELIANPPHTPTFQNTTVATQPTPNDHDAFAVICSIVATCAQDGGAQTPTQQRQQLCLLGVEDKKLQSKLIPVLAKVLPRVERVLETTNFDFAQVVDVMWRLDYVLRSSDAGNVHEPLYFVQLQLQTPRAGDSVLQTVAFTCSVEELRVLVYRIQEAANEVEKLVVGAPSQLGSSA